MGCNDNNEMTNTLDELRHSLDALKQSNEAPAKQGIAGRYIDLDSTIGVWGPSLRTGAARIVGVWKMECEGGAIDAIWVEDSNGVLSSITPYDGLQLLPEGYTPELKENA